MIKIDDNSIIVEGSGDVVCAELSMLMAHIVNLFERNRGTGEAMALFEAALRTAFEMRGELKRD